jgi:hypothetical protein
LVQVAPLIERAGRFADPIEAEADLVTFAALRDAEGTGRARSGPTPSSRSLNVAPDASCDGSNRVASKARRPDD